MNNKDIHGGRWDARAALRRTAIVAVVGLLPLATILVTASASSASSVTTDSIAFSNTTGGNGSYAITVTLSATSSNNSYTAVAYDTTSPTAAITYTASPGSAGCELASSTSGLVTFTSPGTCVITATSASTDKDQGKGSGDGNATGATGTLTLTVLPTPQSISFTSTPPSSPLVGSTYTVSAVATSGLTVQLTVDGTSTSGCRLDTNSDVVTLGSPAGTCVIDANQAGSSNYAPAPQVQQTVTDTLATQRISFTSTPPSSPLVGSTYTVSAVATSGLTVQLTVDGTSTSGCTIDVNASPGNQSPSVTTGVVTLGSPAGTCVIDANQAGNSNYAPAPQVQQTVTDTLASQTISVVSPNPSSVQYGSTSTYQIQATDSRGVTIDYTTSSSTCTVDTTGLISGIEVGNCVVTLSAPATSSVSAATPVTFTLSVQAPPPAPPAPTPPAPTPPTATPPAPTPPAPTPPAPTPPAPTPPTPTPPAETPPAATPPAATPPPPVVIRVSGPKPVRKVKPALPRPMSMVIKPFTEASHTLTKPLLTQVWRLALAIKRKHYTTVTLTGYTDNVFTPAMDTLVIRERSLAVRDQLQFDLSRLRVRKVTITIAPGLTIQLVTLNTTPSSRALNRRVVATLSA